MLIKCTQVRSGSALIIVDDNLPISMNHADVLEIEDNRISLIKRLVVKEKLAGITYFCKIHKFVPESNTIVMIVNKKALVITLGEGVTINREWNQRPHKAFLKGSV